MASEANPEKASEALSEIIRLSAEVVEATGPDDELALRNRAIEIAAIAETLLWTVDPDRSGPLTELYEA